MSAPIGSSFSAAWALFKSRPGFFIGVYILASIIIGIPYGITGAFSANEQSGLAFIFNIVTLIVSSIVGIGMFSIAFAAIDKKPLAVGMLFSNTNRLGKYLLAYILYGIAVAAGTILFIIPGIFLAFRLAFWSPLVVDKGMGAIDALKTSWRLTSGHFFDVLLFGLAATGLAVLGAIPLFLGWLVVFPVILLSFAQFYRAFAAMPAPAAAPKAAAPQA